MLWFGKDKSRFEFIEKKLFEEILKEWKRVNTKNWKQLLILNSYERLITRFSRKVKLERGFIYSEGEIRKLTNREFDEEFCDRMVPREPDFIPYCRYIINIKENECSFKLTTHAYRSPIDGQRPDIYLYRIEGDNLVRYFRHRKRFDRTEE